jgi:hypothetical protein
MNIVNKIRSLIKVAMVTNPGIDSGKIPVHQLTYMGKIGNSVPWFPFGFSAVPDSNSLSLVVTPNGRSEERVDFPSSPQRRVLVETGEVVVYHPATQSKILFKSDGTINIESGIQVNVTAPLTQVNGNLDVTGTLGVAGAAQFDGALGADGDATFGAAITDLNGIDHVTHQHQGGPGVAGDTGVPK